MVEQDVLAANQAFYDSFASGDFDRMEALWAQRRTVTCVHPGWAPLITRETVLESWQAILQNPPTIRVADCTVLLTPNMALVICAEIIDPSVLIATNGFVQENSQWRMVHHQAGQCGMSAADLRTPPPVATMH